jgi:hypothetical protein
MMSSLFVGCQNNNQNTNKEDSFNISSEELDKLVIENPNAQIIKRYRGNDPFVFAERVKSENTYIFNQYEKFEDIYQNGEIYPPHYLVVVDDKIVSCQTLIDGKLKEVTNSNGADLNDEIVIAKIKSGEIVNKISKDIKVNNIYYFATPQDAELCHYIVYFETNKGDWVYLDDKREEMEYIFPSDVFFELKRLEGEYYYYNDDAGMSEGYSGPDLQNLKDIERYNINSPSFDLEIKPKSSYSTEILIITSVGCTVLVAGAIAGFAMRKKKNLQSK